MKKILKNTVFMLLLLALLLLSACQKKTLPLAETKAPADAPAYNQPVNTNK